ncbi:MAG: hypothetical protein KTR35_23685 [Gammaproteobacteria bacterium]|nr:hypothetical protein [Gammaproteobacteria bacterium]
MQYPFAGSHAYRWLWLFAPLYFATPSQAEDGQLDAHLEQAIDLDCDHILDGPYQSSGLHVEPGHCVNFRLTVINRGTESVKNLEIHENTPAFTVYQHSATCSISDCVIIEPDTGGIGVIKAMLDTFGPEQSLEFSFTVKVD